MTEGVGIAIEKYVDERFDGHDALHAAENERLRVTAAALDRRLDQMNEFRLSLNDVVSKSVSRDLYDQGRVRIEDELERLNRWQARATGIILVLVPLAGLIGAVIVKVFFG